jgi:hypothetical protein
MFWFHKPSSGITLQTVTKHKQAYICGMHCWFVRSHQFTNTALRFLHAFSSAVRQMLGYDSQRRGTARTSQFFFIVTFVPFSVFCVLFVCKCVLYYCHWVSTQLQLKKLKKYIWHICSIIQSSLGPICTF